MYYFKMKFLHVVALVLTLSIPKGTECSCDPYIVFHQKNYNGAQGYNDGTTAELCKEQCLSLGTCYAADYNPNASPKCWLHSNVNVLTASLNPNSDTTHFRKDTGCSGNCESWTKFANKYYSGGTAYTSGITEELCKQGCVDKSSMCYGVDFNADSNDKCWHHSNRNVLTSSLYFSSTVTHFRRNLGCAVGSCRQDWTTHNNRHMTGGSTAPTTILETCKQMCVDFQPNCHSIDFNPNSNSPCWIHSNPSTEGNSPSYLYGVTHYKRSEWCPQIPQVCDDLWEHHFDKHRTGGIGRSNADTEGECFDECLSNSPYCYGLDYNPNGGNTKCWIHTTESNSLNPLDGVTHHKRIKDCKDLQCPPSEIRNPENGRVVYHGWNKQHGSNATCEAVYTDFALLRNPKARFLRCNGINLGNSVEYECNEGYTMVGSNKRNCRFDGKWSGAEPICQ